MKEPIPNLMCILGKGSKFSFNINFKKGKVPNKKDVLEKSISTFSEINVDPVLVAEDNIINQKLIKRILENHGYKVEIAENGEEVLERLEKNKYFVILMDIQMPKMDGVTATKKIREMEKLNSAYTPIIAMTANAFKKDCKESLNAGMNDYLTKPIKKDELFRLLKKYESPVHV